MKVLIELPTWMGDAVMTTPAIEMILSNFNDIELSLIGSEISIEIFKHHLKINKKYLLKRNLILFFKNLSNFDKYDVFITFRSSYRSTFMKFFFRSNAKFQFDKKNYFGLHQVEKYNRFIADIFKIDNCPQQLVVHFKTLKKKHTNKKSLGINPGASYGSAKRWYPQEFAKVASELSNEYDIVIFGGPKEVDIAQDIENYLIRDGVFNFQNLSAKTNIEELVNQISNLDLFITGDSGPMHLAAALQVPTVSIFGPTRDYETSQWMNEKSIKVKRDLECQPCMKRKCPLKHHNCMKQIKSYDVLKAVNEII